MDSCHICWYDLQSPGEERQSSLSDKTNQLIHNPGNTKQKQVDAESLQQSGDLYIHWCGNECWQRCYSSGKYTVFHVLLQIPEDLFLVNSCKHREHSFFLLMNLWFQQNLHIIPGCMEIRQHGRYISITKIYKRISVRLSHWLAEVNACYSQSVGYCTWNCVQATDQLRAAKLLWWLVVGHHCCPGSFRFQFVDTELWATVRLCLILCSNQHTPQAGGPPDLSPQSSGATWRRAPPNSAKLCWHLIHIIFRGELCKMFWGFKVITCRLAANCATLHFFGGFRFL